MSALAQLAAIASDALPDWHAGHCDDCGRPMRKRGHPMEPGSVLVAARGKCGGCYARHSLPPRVLKEFCCWCGVRLRGRQEPKVSGTAVRTADGECDRCYKRTRTHRKRERVAVCVERGCREAPYSVQALRCRDCNRKWCNVRRARNRRAQLERARCVRQGQVNGGTNGSEAGGTTIQRENNGRGSSEAASRSGALPDLSGRG